MHHFGIYHAWGSHPGGEESFREYRKRIYDPDFATRGDVYLLGCSLGGLLCEGIKTKIAERKRKLYD
jgi:hypothetical protein